MVTLSLALMSSTRTVQDIESDRKAYISACGLRSDLLLIKHFQTSSKSTALYTASPSKAIAMMYSILNILMTIAVLSAMPLSLAAQTTSDTDLAQYDASDAMLNNATAAVIPEEADDDMLDTLEATALTCGLQSRKGKSCTHSECPAAKWCTANRRKRTCRMKGKPGKRPFGCENCQCRVVGS
jgi:hypothetical protein